MNICSYQKIRNIDKTSLDDRFSLLFKDVCFLLGNSGGFTYTLPPATTSLLGGIKVGAGLVIDNTGVLTTAIADDTSFNWSVISTLGTPNPSAQDGDVYLVAPSSLTGDFTTHANQIATLSTGVYSYNTATLGDLLFDANTGLVQKWSGSAWVVVGRATLHQGGDTFNTSVSIGTKDNFPVNFLVNNAKVGVLTATSFTFGDFSGLSNALNQRIDASGLTFMSNGNYTHKISQTVGGTLEVYTGNGTVLSGARLSGVNTILVSSGFVNTQYESLTIAGTTFPSLAESLILSNTYSSDPKRIVIYGGNTNTPPISILKSGQGNLIVGGDNTTDVQSSQLTVISTTKGTIPAPRMTTSQKLAITSGVFSGTIAGGTGYTNGGYSNVAFTGGTGSGATANINVAANSINGVTPMLPGTGYVVGDVLSASGLGPGTGFTYTITARTGAEGLIVYDTTLHKLFCWDGTTWQGLW